MIKGVKRKPLVVHQDKKGIFCELIRKSDKIFKNCQFGQLSHSIINKGIIKAWHCHKKQTDFIYCADGDIKLVLYDFRKNSQTYKELMEILIGKKYGRQVIKVPPGVAHGYQVINGPAHVIYLVDKEFDPQDELRIPDNDARIGYNWRAQP